MAMLFRVGTVTFADEANGISVEDHEMPDRTRIAFATAPRRHGAIVTEEPVLEQRICSFNGMAKKATQALLRTWIDDTLKAINVQDINFYLIDTTKYLVVSKMDFPWKFKEGSAGTALEYECELFASDPFWKHATTVAEDTVHSNHPTSSLSYTHTNPGSAFVFPVITITANVSGAISNVTFTNTTTGKSFTYAGTIASGKALVFDTANFTCLNDGASDLANLTGVPVWLNSGDNAITFSGGNATVRIAYTPRSYGP